LRLNIGSSIDQSTRIHGEVRSGDDVSWHELSRPQVHGYDLLDATFLDSLRFVSIADEKVARVFEAPREFIETVKNLHVAELSTDLVSRLIGAGKQLIIDCHQAERPRAATVPPLGLSNKAVSGEGMFVN
jgi:elongator complex protein 2